MKRIFLTLLLGLPLLLTACGEDNSEYPKKLHFGREGGVQTVSGVGFEGHLTIVDADSRVVGTYYPVYAQQMGDTVETEENVSVAPTYDRTDARSESASGGVTEERALWLRLTSGGGCGPEISITAAPNTTGKSRTLYINGGSMDDSFTIKVTQSGN